MRKLHRLRRHHWLACLLIAGVLNLSTGCAAVFSGTNQNVRVITTPPGKTVYFNGMRVKDGEMLTVQKHFREPEFNIGAPERPVMYPMHYDPDPWLIGDGVLLFFFLIPGLIALGVDFGTGAWRNLEDPQNVYARE